MGHSISIWYFRQRHTVQVCGYYWHQFGPPRSYGLLTQTPLSTTRPAAPSYESAPGTDSASLCRKSAPRVPVPGPRGPGAPSPRSHRLPLCPSQRPPSALKKTPHCTPCRRALRPPSEPCGPNWRSPNTPDPHCVRASAVRPTTNSARHAHTVCFRAGKNRTPRLKNLKPNPRFTSKLVNPGLARAQVTTAAAGHQCQSAKLATPFQFKLWCVSLSQAGGSRFQYLPPFPRPHQGSLWRARACCHVRGPAERRNPAKKRGGAIIAI